MRPRRRWGSQRGSASLELLGTLPLMILAALAGIQLLLVTATVTATQSSARAGSRMAGLGASVPTASAAAKAALPGWLRSDATVTFPGATITDVAVEVPLVFPGLSTSAITVTRRAELPRT